jgi:CheY-like chemotaxis protein
MSTVLVVDDEFGIAELFEAILTDEGHHVLTAINGRHGLEVLLQERVDLIFLDYMMPVMNGAAMLNEMAADPVLRRLPVVLMSSMAEAVVAERCAGYTHFMRKPFKVADVVALTEQLLGQQGMEGRHAGDR